MDRKIKERLLMADSDMGREYRNEVLNGVMNIEKQLALNVMFAENKSELTKALKAYNDYNETKVL